MTTSIRHARGDSGSAQQVTKRWHDIQPDILMLSTSLALIPEQCTCGNARAHVKGACACCTERNRLSAVHCADCDALIEKIEPQIQALALDTLRFLPPVSPDPPTGCERTSTQDIRRQVETVTAVVERLRSAATEYRETCHPASLDTMKQCTQELFRAGRRLNDMLENGMGRSDETRPRSSC